MEVQRANNLYSKSTSLNLLKRVIIRFIAFICFEKIAQLYYEVKSNRFDVNVFNTVFPRLQSNQLILSLFKV